MKKQDKSLINKTFSVNQTKIKVISKIAEGSYADVYKAQRIQDGSMVALKKLYLQNNNAKAMASYHSETQTLRKLGQHPNIVKLFEKQEVQVPGSNDLEVFILFELCPGGNLYDLIGEKSLIGMQGLDEDTLIQVITDVVSGLIHMHLQDPPIAHRDIKLENIIKGGDGNWKLCDFGSSTSKSVYFMDSSNRDIVAEEIEQTTTPIYRAPEQLDFYSQYPINEKVDIWGLACVIYTLMFFKSPFNPGEKLAQINGTVKIPNTSQYSKGLITLLQAMFEKNPNKRMGMGEVWSVMDSLKTIKPLVGYNTFQQVDPMNQPSFNPINKKQSSQNVSNPYRIQPEQVDRPEQNLANKQHSNSDQKSSISSNIINSSSPVKYNTNMNALVNRITQPVDQAINEKDFRIVVKRILQKTDTETCFYKGLASQEYKIVTIISLKALIVTHKLQLYCPQLSQKSLESLYMQISNSWKEITQNKSTYSKDQFRCEYFAKLISAYADILRFKGQIVQEFNNFIDGGYTLSNYFKQKEGKSPLQVKFLDKLNKLWSQFTLLQEKLFKQPLFLWSLRLNIITNILEDQYLLLCLLTHLIFAFKTVYQRFSQNVPQEVKDFIANFETVYENNLRHYLQFVSKASKIPELSHLARKLPQIPSSLANEVKSSNFGKLNKDLQNKPDFKLSDYLNIRNSILGLQLPVPFKLYEQFETNCHESYDILIGTQIYRSKLGETMQKQFQDNGAISHEQIVDEMLENRQKFQTIRPSIKGRSSSLRKSSNKGGKELSPAHQNRERRGALLEGFLEIPSVPPQRAESKDSKHGHQILSDHDLDFLRTNVLEDENIQQQSNLLHFDHLEDIQNQIHDILQLDASFKKLNQQQPQKSPDNNNPDPSQQPMYNADQDFSMQWIDQVAQNIASQQQQASTNFFDTNTKNFTSQQQQPENQLLEFQTADYLISLAQDSDSNNDSLIQLKNQNSFVSNLLGGGDIQLTNQNVQQSGKSAAMNVQQQSLLAEQAKIQRKFEILRKQQEDEIVRQQQVILKMKQDSVQGDKIKEKENLLNQSKQQFKQEQLEILGQKTQLEVELKKFEEEKVKFEMQRMEEQRKIKEQQVQIEEEKLKLEKMKIQMAEQHRQMEENQKNFSKLNEEHKRSQSVPVTGDDKNVANQFLIEEFAKGQDFFLLKLEDLKIDKQIGMGASAEVYQGSYKELDVAIKKLRITSLTADNTLKEFKREVSTLTRVRHPNLVLFVGASADKGHIVIVTEFCHGGTLFTLLHEQKKYELSWKQRFQMALDIAKGMHFLHSQEPHILHRDLKSLNLLLSQPVTGKSDFVQVKITDFGLSRHNQSETEMMTGQAGTFHWMAPETLENKPYTHKADVYSYGIVLWEIICREPPFKSYNPHDIIYRVINFQDRPDMKIVPPDCPRELIAVMTKCWDQNPANRPDFADIVRALKTVTINN